MWRIAVILGLFMAFIVTLVTYISFHKVDLVSTDYYQQEVEYQKIIEAKRNGLKFKEHINFTQNDKNLSMSFINTDGKVTRGEVYFYHPQNAKYDFLETLSLSEEGHQVFSKDNLEKGNYTIRVHWVSGQQEFQVEKPYYIN